jgi:hypothetical protein
MKRNGIITSILAIVAIFCTLQFMPSCNKLDEVSPPTTYAEHLKQKADDLAVSQAREVAILKQRNDSLNVQLADKKQKLVSLKSQAPLLEKQLREQAARIDKGKQFTDSLSPVLESYIELKQLSDSACAEQIVILEEIVANKDSEVLLCRESEGVLRDLSTEQQSRIDYLNQQLETAHKQQKRRLINNRILSSALLVATSVASALLINKNIK